MFIYYINHPKCDNKILNIVHFLRSCWRSSVYDWLRLLRCCFYAHRAEQSRAGLDIALAGGQPCENNHVYRMQGSMQTNLSLSPSEGQDCVCVLSVHVVNTPTHTVF